MIVKELFAKLGLQVDQNAFDAAERTLGSLKGSFVAFGTAAVSAMGAAALSIAKATADAADSARLMAQRVGVDAQVLQEFTHAADSAGTSTEALARGLKFLAKSGVKDVRGEMLRLAEQFQGMPDAGDRVRLALQKFGKGGEELIPMLVDGREELAKMAEEAHALGLVFGQEGLKTSKKFNDSLLLLSKTFLGIRNRIGLLLIGPLTKAIETFQSWVATVSKWNADKLEAGLQVLGIAFAAAGALAVASAARTLAAWTAAAAPVLFVVAALTLLGLVLEDVYQFFTGGKSVIGEFSDYVKKEFGSWTNFFYSILKWFGSLLDEFGGWIAKGFHTVVDAIKGALDALDRRARKALLSALSTAMRIASLLPGGALTAKIAEAVGLEGFGGGASPAASVGAGVNVSKTPTVSAPQFRADITVNAAPGMSAQAVAEQVTLASEVWWDGKMREAAAGVE